jgi:AcrR family transcriptional regulator
MLPRRDDLGDYAEANISPGHLYHYFASKEAIIAGMADGRVIRHFLAG